jgi:hypothetical protein
MKTVHWTIIAAILTAVWLGFMVWMSSDAYKHKDPKRIVDYKVVTKTTRN